jgi:uncharacterized membrane protein YfcA
MDIFYLIILIVAAFTIASAAGFGSNIIGLSIGLNLYPLTFLMPVLLPLNIIINLIIALKNRSNISPEILKKVMFLFPAGMIPGILFFLNFAMSRYVIIIFAVFILSVSLRDIYRQYFNKHFFSSENSMINRNYLEKIYMFTAGVIHGIFATGGPLLVLATARLNPGKDAFRSTLPLVWASMNFILTITYIPAGIFNETTLKTTMLLLPFALIGFFIGEHIQKKIKEEHFKTLVSLLLIASASAMIIKNLFI